jgi:N-acyl-D-amino-acid deacylase
MLDFVIRGCVVIDGTGAPPRRADVGLSGDEIAWVGRGSQRARVAVNADGLVLCPGFIDAHSHTDYLLLANPLAQSKVMQGVTTEVGGNCGFSPVPADEEDVVQFRRWLDRFGLSLSWSSLAEFFSLLGRVGIAINFASLAGHGTIRARIMGRGDFSPSAARMRKMKELLASELSEGALGISTGLAYVPGCFAQTSEIIELARVAAQMGGIYATHMRDEGARLIEAVEEAIEIGRETGIRVQISHLKAAGKQNWGKVRQALAMIGEARRDGVDVAADQYPYTASCAGLNAILPGWVREGGARAMIARLKDPAARRRIAREIASRSRKAASAWQDIHVSRVYSDENRRFEGRTIASISKTLRRTPLDAVCDLLVADEGATEMVRASMCERDVEHVMRHPWVMFGSDASALAFEGPLSEGKPHPRGFGTFPRILGHFVRERKVLPLEEAVRKMTSLPASRFGLVDRGAIRPGMKADLVLFDPDAIGDEVTYAGPVKAPRGIHSVWVNGVRVVKRGELIRRQGRIGREGKIEGAGADMALRQEDWMRPGGPRPGRILRSRPTLHSPVNRGGTMRDTARQCRRPDARGGRSLKAAATPRHRDSRNPAERSLAGRARNS